MEMEPNSSNISLYQFNGVFNLWDHSNFELHTSQDHLNLHMCVWQYYSIYKTKPQTIQIGKAWSK